MGCPQVSKVLRVRPRYRVCFVAHSLTTTNSIWLATRENYSVSFPVLAKHKVIGPEAHPFYRYTPTCLVVFTPFVMQAQHTLTRTVCTVHSTASLAAWRRQIGTFGCTSLAPTAHFTASFLAQLSPLMAG